MESRTERVVFETDRVRIEGDLSLPREGYRSRLSDFLNRGEADFIPLVNATVTSLANGESYEREFLAVGRGHVVIAYPVNPG